MVENVQMFLDNLADYGVSNNFTALELVHKTNSMKVISCLHAFAYQVSDIAFGSKVITYRPK